VSAPAGSPGAGSGSSVASAQAPERVAIPPKGGTGAGSGVAEPVGKLAGSAGKRPGKAKAPGKTSEKPLAPVRTSLSADDIERAMTAVGGKARACVAGAAAPASLRLTIDPSGRIARVAVTGPLAGTPAGACLTRAVQAATFPPWSGARQSFDYSYPLSD
jgi:hypothetical protein